MEGTSEAEAREKDPRDKAQTCNKANKTQTTPLRELSSGPATQQDERNLPTETTKKKQIHNNSGNAVDEDDSRVKSDKRKNEKIDNRIKSDHPIDSAQVCVKKDRAKNDHKDSHIDKDGKNEEKGEEDAEEVVNPLSVDIYDKLCAENSKDQTLQWDSYMVGDNLQKTCRRLFLSERQLYALMMSIFMVVTFAMVFGLCVLQAQMSMTSKQLLAKVQGPKKPIPEGMYTLYYDYLESGVLPENVDMRANTSIFVH